jgi:hypothetical protein
MVELVSEFYGKAEQDWSRNENSCSAFLGMTIIEKETYFTSLYLIVP